MGPAVERLPGTEAALAHGAGTGGGEPPPEVTGRVGELGDQARLAEDGEFPFEEWPACGPVVAPLPVPRTARVAQRREGVEAQRVQRPVRARCCLERIVGRGDAQQAGWLIRQA